VGKTTLLRLIAGLLPGALVSADGGPLEGRVALMAQQDLLLPWLSALDNVLLGYRLRGVSRAELARLKERGRELLARVGLGGREADLPATLSGGMRQRVALARTLMEDRPVVLMDEPFSALDAITRFRLQDLAAEMLAGRTVLLVTHSPSEAVRLGHRLYVLSGQPARPEGPLVPRGAPPRDPADPAVLSLEAELLRELTRSLPLAEAS
jgi:putative hydroxymethylpyrimidine transport system ATP-binding protein